MGILEKIKTGMVEEIMKRGVEELKENVKKIKIAIKGGYVGDTIRERMEDMETDYMQFMGRLMEECKDGKLRYGNRHEQELGMYMERVAGIIREMGHEQGEIKGLKVRENIESGKEGNMRKKEVKFRDIQRGIIGGLRELNEES